MADYLQPVSRVFTQIYEGKTKEVIAAIESGVIRVDEPYFASSNDTPLFWACVLGNKDLVDYLLAHGADPNFQQAKYLATPLHAAARRGFSDVCMALIKGGADLTLRERNGKTAGEYVSHSRCKAAHTLSDEVKKAIGFEEETGAYAPEEPDLEFWGKYGPPPKLSKEEEAKILEEEAALWESLKKKK